MSYTPQFDQGDISLENDTLAYDGFFKMRALQLSHRRFDGSQSAVFERELCVRGDAVGILLYDPALAKFALVEQIRIGAIERPQSPWLLEIVAGMLDKAGEDKQQLARRESFEEAGLQVGLIEPMLEYFCSPGGSTEFFSLFCGQVDLRDVAADNFGVADENEDIRLHILDVSEALTLLRQGVINNAMTIIALQWFQLHRQQLDAAWLP
jgi:ADP-ribose pyrophosphatase